MHPYLSYNIAQGLAAEMDGAAERSRQRVTEP
jgi:hypothetical protein